ncbi:MAG TPA: FtsX-like permease family protein [Bryobacteraceae bacterium]|nr:FtsX-like permease family protein [Bryobacteraceae bacterium]
MIYRLVLENFKHRPVRTFLSAIAIGIQVTMILTLAGVSNGYLEGMAQRARGTGADIVVRPPDSAIIGFSSNMREGIVNLIRGMTHVAIATGTFVQPMGNLDYITGINLAEFTAMSGGFQYLEGGPFASPDDMLIDDVYARQHRLRVGSQVELGHKWRVCGIVESGKLSRTFVQIGVLQGLFAGRGMITNVYVKADDPNNTQAIIGALRQKLPTYTIYSMDDLASLYSVNNVPMLKEFIGIVIGIAVIVGLLVVLLTMYTAVLERTREIGILKALGASPRYVVGILMREAVLLAIAGTIAGILMTYGTRALMHAFAPGMTQDIVPGWWPYAALIALFGSLVGALYPGLKAARQDAIEALSYE